VGESKRHLEQRTALYQILKAAFADRASIGSDQFIYWDAGNPKACLSPDAFIQLGRPDHLFDSWKVLERGAPHVAVEVISASDARDAFWDDKLEKYRALGVTEVVRFDPLDDAPLRIWDHVEGDLVERDLEGKTSTPCLPLGLYWVVVEHADLGPMLRLAHDRNGEELLPAPFLGK